MARRRARTRSATGWRLSATPWTRCSAAARRSSAAGRTSPASDAEDAPGPPARLTAPGAVGQRAELGQGEIPRQVLHATVRRGYQTPGRHVTERALQPG